jgi:NhaA family Na+:H+ antiporter
VRPLQDFLATSTSAAYVLFGAILIALIWANSPWGESYERLWHTTLVVRFGDVRIGSDLHFWIQDGLMTLFFLLVGVEIKREVICGELRRPRAAALPAIAAIGGMAIPALLYLAIAGSGPAARGWGVPLATDIALALGALALASRFVHPSLKPLMLTLAIVDDIGAIVVIASFYSDGGNPAALVWAATLVGAVFVAQRIHIRSLLVYVVLGAGLWYAFLRAGIHPTIAGVIMGLLTPAEPFQRPRAVSDEAQRIAAETDDEPEPPDADAPLWLDLATLSREAVSPLARVEHALLPWSSFVIVPLFALASAGVRLSPATISATTGAAVAIGIVVGLVIGKPLGIYLATWLARRTRMGTLPDGVGTRSVVGLGATAGIGFTVALFIADLAFEDQPLLLGQAKIAILVASVIAGVAGWLIFRTVRVQSSVRVEPR